MSEETAENETGSVPENVTEDAAQDVTVSSETAVSQDDDEVIEGEIVSGTWVNPNVPADDPRHTTQAAQFSYVIPEAEPSFMRVVFGSVVMVSEEIRDRASGDAADDDTQQRIQAAINQAVSQDQSIDQRPFANLRYGTIGLVSGVLDSGQSGAGRATNIANSAVQTAGKIIAPVWNSFLFAPLHQPAMRVEQVGEAKVDEWIRRGRVEEVRSRALAEVSIHNFVDESVTELTENEQLQMIVQEVIASQSTSLAAEILDEARERLVSLDIVLMGKLRRNLVAAPDFRASFNESLAERHTRYQPQQLAASLAGSYAGPITRLVSFLIDVVILLIVVGLISSFVSNALALFGLTDVVQDYLQSGGLIATIIVVIVTLFNLLLIPLYFIIAWNWTGSTFGDLLFGIRVVSNKGGHVSFWRAIWRFIGAIISTLFLGLGFIWALFDGRRQGWHDKFGGTFVLYDWPARPDENFLNEQVKRGLEAADLN